MGSNTFYSRRPPGPAGGAPPDLQAPGLYQGVCSSTSPIGDVVYSHFLLSCASGALPPPDPGP
eukprot:11414594-Alexandrium_andersonii.AAC.1